MAQHRATGATQKHRCEKCSRTLSQFRLSAGITLCPTHGPKSCAGGNQLCPALGCCESPAWRTSVKPGGLSLTEVKKDNNMCEHHRATLDIDVAAKTNEQLIEAAAAKFLDRKSSAPLLVVRSFGRPAAATMDTCSWLQTKGFPFFLALCKELLVAQRV